MRLYSLLVLSSSLLAAVSGANLDVKLKTGTFRGASTTAGIERWLGIPFALPPVGERRFKAPVPVTDASDALKDATKFGNACPQPPSDIGAPISEDCLYLNVFRPQNTTADAGLPVVVWIHGGQYTTGAASEPEDEPTRMIRRSVDNGKPIVMVSTNYRLNTFGFLASALMDPKDLNAGLLDQREALRFVNANVRAFGGDPDKVTIWGQSAGAGSVQAHFVFPTPEKLFRAGIGESAVGPFKNSPEAREFDIPGLPFARLVNNVGCSTDPDVLSCLRKVPFNTLLNISNQMIDSTLNMQLWQPCVAAGSMVPERASARIERGDFLHLPYFAGTTVNEGTTFSTTLRNRGLSGARENDAFATFIRDLFINNSTITDDVVDRIIAMWPANDPSLGAPFNTGDSLFDRAEAWYGDEMFLAPRRLFFQKGSPLQPMFAYRFAEFIPGNDPALGVFHASDLSFLLGPALEAVEATFSEQMIDAWVNFVNDLNPGDGFPEYSNDNPLVVQLQRDNITVIPDTWDVDMVEFLNTAKVLDEFEKKFGTSNPTTTFQAKMPKSDLKLDDIWDASDDIDVTDLRSALPSLAGTAVTAPKTTGKKRPPLPLITGLDGKVTSPRKSNLGSPSSPDLTLTAGRRVPRPRALSRSRTLPRISPSESNRPRRTRSDIEALQLDTEVLASIRRWILGIAIVQFDLDDGPVLDAVFPPIHFSPQEAANIAFSSFPDSLQFDQGSQNHSFRVRELPDDERCPITNDGFLYGYAHFTQRRSPQSKRGYEQRSVVILTHHPYPALFTSITSVFGPLFEAHGIPMLESACHNIATWPDPSPGMTLELGFLGSVLHLELPRTIDSQQLTDTSSFKEKYDPKLHILASAPPFTPPPLLLFEACLPHLWSIWECVVLGEPILIFGTSPVETSQAVWWFRDLLRPIPLAGDIRPYFTIHDQDHSLLVNKLPPKSGTLLGVTNPFFHRSCSHWPHILSLGRKLQHSAGMSGKSSHKLAAAGPEPGWKTSVHKRYISKDRALLKQLEGACRGSEQQKVASDTSLRLKPFNSANFFVSLKAHGTPLPFRSTSKRTEFYERWLKTPAFGLWLAQQERIVQSVLKERSS
ncbi:hypothetical protein VNI00_007800 [Paramarasmius palmivorus]|uniref:UDENN domain-containing protein n=1 Tax=Paramarasmius palmivorus TaxID=297713 RepID=A0AAW0CXT6_9AGAR